MWLDICKYIYLIQFIHMGVVRRSLNMQYLMTESSYDTVFKYR